MIETRLLARLLATARTVTALGAVPAIREVGDEAAQQVRAHVAARLADGTFRVLVDGKPLKLALPPDVEPGDVIELRIENRATGTSGGRVAAGAEAGTLSSTGRFISALLTDVAAAPLRQARPILPLPPAAPGELPQSLARAVERSGLFYESHQARWVEGDYPLESLLQEPQAELAANKALARDAAGVGRAPDAASAATAANADDTLVDAPRAGAAAVVAIAEEEAQPQPAAREVLPLVRSQLEALDSRHITWLGDIWPGQPLRWEIEADDSRPDAEPGERGWSTRFSLELPALGEIGADLAFVAGGVRLHLEAHTPEAAALMRSTAPELEQALTAAGIAPVHVEIRCDEPAA